MPPPLLTIPSELLLTIFEDCDIGGKAALVKVNRHMYNQLNQRLYLFNVREEGRSALVWAAWKGNMETMELACDAGAVIDDDVGSDPNQIRKFLPTGFMDSLVRAPSPVGFPNMWEFMPLHVAASNGNTEMVAWILSRGVRIDHKAVGYLASHNWFHWNDFLRINGYPPNLYYDVPSFSPLHLAICEGHMSIAKQLIDHGASGLTCATTGSSAIHIASLVGRVDMVEFLAANRPEVIHSVDKGGMSALHYAAFSPAGAKVIPTLIELGLDVNGQDQSGMTSLHVATSLGSVHAAIAMVDAGAVVSTWPVQANPTHFTPLHLACCPPQRRSLLYADFGQARLESDEQRLRATWEERRQVLVQKMLEKGDIDINANASFNWNGRRLINCNALRAAIQEPIAVVKMLLDAGAQSLPDTLYHLLTSGEWQGGRQEKEAKILLLLRYFVRLDVRLSLYRGTLLEYIVARHSVSRSACPLICFLIKHLTFYLHASDVTLAQAALAIFRQWLRRPNQELETCTLLVEAGGIIEPWARPEIRKVINDWITHSDVHRHLSSDSIAHLLRIFPATLSFNRLLIEALISFGRRGNYYTAHRGPNRRCCDGPNAVTTLLRLVNFSVAIRDDFGRSALHFATACAHSPAMKTLILHGHSPNVSDIFGITPLHHLLARGEASPEGELYGLDDLLEHGANPFYVAVATRDMLSNYESGGKVPKPNPSQYTALEISLYHNRGMSQMLKHLSLANIPASRIPSFTVNCISLCLSRTARLTSLCQIAKVWGEMQPEKCADLNKALLEVLQALWDSLAYLNGPKRTVWSVVAEKLAVCMLWLFCTNIMDTSRGDGADDVWGCIAQHMLSRHLSRPPHQEAAPLDTVLDSFFLLRTLPSAGRIVVFPRPLDFVQPQGDVFKWLDGLAPHESLFDDSRMDVDPAPAQEGQPISAEEPTPAPAQEGQPTPAPAQEGLPAPAEEPTPPTEGSVTCSEEDTTDEEDTDDEETAFTPGIEGQGPIGMEIWVRLQVLDPFRRAFLERVKQLRV
ncbi:hypothetical protein RB595_005295 [Gaeumannomyces hyphopodioides]